MGLKDLSDRAAVHVAVREYDSLGRGQFLDKYGVSPSVDHFVHLAGRSYPSNAIATAAHAVEFPESDRLSGPEIASESDAAARQLQFLGFVIVARWARDVGEGPPLGAWYGSRKALIAAGLHRTEQNGIDYVRQSGLAVTIVLNGGYKDDRDLGDRVIYTGQGGQNERRTEQIVDQEWRSGNAGLRNAQTAGAPVRIVRGFKPENQFSPPTGYRYDGLYTVVSSARVPSSDGPLICQFQLEAILGESTPLGLVLTGDDARPSGKAEPSSPTRVPTVVMRIVRDSLLAIEVKRLHDFHCQVCGIRLETASGPYAEGAHVRPVGSPHHGPDVLENLLCLCPNDHVRLDKGAIFIDSELLVRVSATGELLGGLRTVSGHSVDPAHLGYQRSRIAM